MIEVNWSYSGKVKTVNSTSFPSAITVFDKPINYIKELRGNCRQLGDHSVNAFLLQATWKLKRMLPENETSTRAERTEQTMRDVLNANLLEVCEAITLVLSK